MSPTAVREAVSRAREARAVAEADRAAAGVATLLRLAEAERVATERAGDYLEMARSKALPEPLRPVLEEAYAQAREEALRELPQPPEVRARPRWEAFKAGVKALATQAGRQAWANLRALAAETKEALKYQLKEQLGIDLSQIEWKPERSGVVRSRKD